MVAGEVKDLAQETARATGDIIARVDQIQADTESAIRAIAGITTVIAQVNDFQTTISAAIEEQSATTAEMSRAIVEASTGTDAFASSLGTVAESVSSTSQGLAETRGAVQSLSVMATDLQTLVSRFTY